MAVILKSDTYKLNIERKMALSMMILTGLVLTMLIVANIYWIGNYDAATISQNVISAGKKATPENMEAYVRLRALFSIIGNTLVFAVFMVVAWMGISKRRLGMAFGLFWMFLFITNAIATPFYSVQIDYFAIITAILNGCVSILVLIWFAQLIAYRQRLRQEIAQKRKY